MYCMSFYSLKDARSSAVLPLGGEKIRREVYEVISR